MRTFVLYMVMLIFAVFEVQGKNPRISDENEQLLQQLDQAIARKASYQRDRKLRADSLCKAAYEKEEYDRIWTLQSSYEIYNRFLTDSVFSTLERIKACPEYEGDSLLQVWVSLCEARNYGVMGFYNTSLGIIEKCNPCCWDRNLKLHYYNTHHAVLGWMAEFDAKASPEMAKQLLEKAEVYRDSILDLEPNPISRSLVRANRLCDMGQYQASVDTLRAIEKICDSWADIYIYASLSQAYDKMNDNEQALHYLALTSINDIKSGVAEYMALPILAERMHDMGEDERAYNYLVCSLEDANLCHCTLRAIEATYMFLIIDQARSKAIEQHQLHKRLLLIGAFLILLIVVTGLAFHYYSRHRRMLDRVLEEKKHVEEVIFMAEHDELTSLLNRRGGRRRLRYHVEALRPGYLCVLDVDLFKQVNDTYGHEVGDKVLQRVAECLAALPDQIAIRLGGDEFLTYCIAPISTEEYRLRMENFFDDIRAIRIPVMGDKEISVSLGAVYYDGQQATTVDALFHVADMRLYKSKQTKGCCLTMED
ncbi:MAG: diguanylate cyclase [Bacteroidales bacterium]|nr:diguanylate cyclase [Bacteroidales bacterium]